MGGGSMISAPRGDGPGPDDLTCTSWKYIDMRRKTLSLPVLIVSALLAGPSIRADDQGQPPPSNKADRPDDRAIVRQLLDANGLNAVSVPRVAILRDGRVVELKLYGVKTSSKNLPESLRTIPAEIGKLDKLEKLIINSNELPELPETLFDLENLTELDLSNNTLESLSPKVGRLKRLKVLRLMMNQLTEVPPSLGMLTQLVELDLGFNPIPSLPAEVGGLAMLERLKLRGNQLTTLPASFAKLRRLKSLDLIENRLNTIPRAIYELKSLQSLYLGRNQIRSVDPEIGSLIRLRSLTLDRNNLTALPDSLKNLVALDYFTIESNDIEDLEKTLDRIFAGKKKPRISK
jgi:hypothetical protein